MRTTPAPAPPLEVRGLAKRFGALHALRDVSFDVKPGEVFGYLGPNGAGKTTTLRIILGLMRASGGSARLFGQPADSAGARDELGFLPGDVRLYADMTGRAVLDHFARFRPEYPPVLRAELIEALALEATALRQRVKFLSHGTRQKLGLIIAMQHDPSLLLLDEPSNGLDPLVQRAFRSIVRDLARRGRAVLLSSHVLSEVEAVCTRVAILRAGSIVALESIEALRASVVRRVRVRFRGGPPAELERTAGVTEVRQESGDVVVSLRGDVNPLLRALAVTDVERLVFPEPELEDIFLGYYRADAEARA
jgi:ABC-2 type transport system ATP-binding protein